MAKIGVEWIDHFAEARASAGISSGAQDLSCPYYIAEWFAPTLAAAGHTLKVHHANQGVAERHMHDSADGGADNQFADSVDLYLIITHGHYDSSNREVELLFDNQQADWFGHSKKWRFGDTCDLEWLMIYGCETIDANDVPAHLHVFQRLHIFCGAYGDMFDSFTIDEAGQDTADNLLAGDTVTDSWLDGVSDWWVSNHPAAISIETRATYNNGNPDWSNTTLGGDHLWGSGVTRADIKPEDAFWMGIMWNDSGIYG